MIVETNALEYALTAILLIIIEEKEVYPLVFHSCLFKTTELNYDMHNKEFLTVFEAFYTWCHYLEGLKCPIDIVTNHKNLEFSSTAK